MTEDNLTNIKADEYEKVEELSVKQQCRDKLSVFFGSRDNFRHGLQELISNSKDEINDNFDNGIIEIELMEDMETILIKDTGRGMPIYRATNGKPNYKLFFETLFAGTNFDNNKKNVKKTGTNGCGTCVLNHTSKLFKVQVARDGGEYELIYTDGGDLKSYERLGDSDEHYTKVTFKLDNEVYPCIKYNIKELQELCEKNSVTSYKTTIVLKHLNEEFTYHYNDLEEYFDKITNKKTCKNICGISKQFDYNNEFNNIELVMSTSSDVIQESYLNTTYLCNKGSINDGIINGTKLFINRYCKDNKLLDKKLGNLSNDDISDSISFLVSIESSNVEYENQTKMSTSKNLYKQIAQEYVMEVLEIFQLENSSEFEKFVKHILQVQKFNGKTKESKNKFKKKLSEKVDTLASRIEGFYDSKIHGEDAELFICEGKSALGSVVSARDSKTQGAIAIRGKILNCLKAKYEDIFKNEIIIDLVKALGCGIKADKKNKDLDNFNINNLRFGKVILTADADADGQNIICLLLTMIYILMPDLFYQNKIYIANTPLYEISLENDEMLYIYNEAEKEKKLKGIEGRKYKIARVKG